MTGYDPPGGWAASAWVLNAIYERGDLAFDLTHHELRQHAVALGLQDPAFVGEVNLDDHTTTTGLGLGFAAKPPPPWRRLRWNELGERDGFEYCAVSGRWPHPAFIPQAEWDDPLLLPADAWPRLGPTEASSWPVAILPPTEGSLDEESLLALIDVLSQQTAPDLIRTCEFYYGPAAFLREGATLFEGNLLDLPAFVAAMPGTQLTPNNTWPPDHSWLVYTDYDLWASRVSGSESMIEALVEDPRLDAVRCA